MLAPRELSEEYQAWNAKWGAPFGYPGAQKILGRTDLPLVHRARLAGPFAFQANNTTRYFEYPWVFEQMIHVNPATIIDVGAGITGFQFILGKLGHRVYCVDPGLAEPDSYGWGSERVSHQDLNAAFHTTVEPVPALLEDATFTDGTVDYVTCISTLEHVSFEGSVNLLRSATDLLKPGGRFIATVDLFLDLVPFTRRLTNKWGENLDLGMLFKTEPRLKLVTGDVSQLYGCEGFAADEIQERCSEFYVGHYPCMAQCFVLEKISE